MKKIILIISPLFLAGCTTSGYFLSGGDRSAGSVTLMCQYDITTACQQHDQKMLADAKQACRNWGYSDAKPFGAIKDVPSFTQSYAGHKEIQYQCIGHLEQ